MDHAGNLSLRSKVFLNRCVHMRFDEDGVVGAAGGRGAVGKSSPANITSNSSTSNSSGGSESDTTENSGTGDEEGKGLLSQKGEYVWSDDSDTDHDSDADTDCNTDNNTRASIAKERKESEASIEPSPNEEATRQPQPQPQPNDEHEPTQQTLPPPTEQPNNSSDDSISSSEQSMAGTDDREITDNAAPTETIVQASPPSPPATPEISATIQRTDKTERRPPASTDEPSPWVTLEPPASIPQDGTYASSNDDGGGGRSPSEPPNTPVPDDDGAERDGSSQGPGGDLQMECEKASEAGSVVRHGTDRVSASEDGTGAVVVDGDGGMVGTVAGRVDGSTVRGLGDDGGDDASDRGSESEDEIYRDSTRPKDGRGIAVTNVATGDDGDDNQSRSSRASEDAHSSADRSDIAHESVADTQKNAVVLQKESPTSKPPDDKQATKTTSVEQYAWSDSDADSTATSSDEQDVIYDSRPPRSATSPSLDPATTLSLEHDVLSNLNVLSQLFPDMAGTTPQLVPQSPIDADDSDSNPDNPSTAHTAALERSLPSRPGWNAFGTMIRYDPARDTTVATDGGAEDDEPPPEGGGEDDAARGGTGEGTVEDPSPSAVSEPEVRPAEGTGAPPPAKDGVRIYEQAKLESIFLEGRTAGVPAFRLGDMLGAATAVNGGKAQSAGSFQFSFGAVVDPPSGAVSEQSVKETIVASSTTDLSAGGGTGSTGAAAPGPEPSEDRSEDGTGGIEVRRGFRIPRTVLRAYEKEFYGMNDGAAVLRNWGREVTKEEDDGDGTESEWGERRKTLTVDWKRKHKAAVAKQSKRFKFR